MEWKDWRQMVTCPLQSTYPSVRCDRHIYSLRDYSMTKTVRMLSADVTLETLILAGPQLSTISPGHREHTSIPLPISNKRPSAFLTRLACNRKSHHVKHDRHLGHTCCPAAPRAA